MWCPIPDTCSLLPILRHAEMRPRDKEQLAVALRICYSATREWRFPIYNYNSEHAKCEKNHNASLPIPPMR